MSLPKKQGPTIVEGAWCHLQVNDNRTNVLRLFGINCNVLCTFYLGMVFKVKSYINLYTIMFCEKVFMGMNIALYIGLSPCKRGWGSLL